MALRKELASSSRGPDTGVFSPEDGLLYMECVKCLWLRANLQQLLQYQSCCSDGSQGCWLCRNQRLRVALAERVQQVAQLRSDIQKLSQESELAARDSFEIAEYMRKELLHKEDINVRTRAALSEVRSL